MEHLLIALLKLVARLVLFAWSGDWHKLDKLIARWREIVAELRREPAPPQPEKSGRKRAPRPPRRRATRPAPDTAWPFEYPDELTRSEPLEELRGGESVIESALPGSRRAAAAPRRAEARARPPAQLPLALAIRDPRVLRDAMVLTAALGPRRTGGRGRG
jgi:hypothetical protein